ncbi:MAG: glucokinase [Ardenticatenaceae bacterium]|nr:glucokinase [Ardenticatenaceae bacterium]MCB8987921.1 glucokinase [Ardenticatenaceae bacterium]
MLLAGDIGGTKTVLALFATESHTLQSQYEVTFWNRDFDSLEAVILAFLRETTAPITSACFGVAGPVVQGRAQITNLPWVIDATAVQDAYGFPQVFLLNDLEAIASAVPYLTSADLVTLNEGIPEPQGALAVIAPGTGLGEAFLVWNGRAYQAHPSEGGHVSFGPTNTEQMQLLTYMLSRFNHVSVERVCSGSGIPNLYGSLRQSGRYEEPDWLRQALVEAIDPTPVIVEAAIENNEPICVATLDLFLDILADEASNMALKVLSTGGIYLGGGIPPRILPQLQQPRFMEVFTNKGRFSEMMQKMPVHVIRNPKSALYGAAYYGLNHPLRKKKKEAA